MIDTDSFSARLRAQAVDLSRQALLISDLRGSGQEDDLSEPVNCGGYGRVHHFTTQASPGWPLRLGRISEGGIVSAMFQAAAAQLAVPQ